MASVVGFMQKASAFLCICHDIGAKIGGNHKIGGYQPIKEGQK